MQVRDIMTTTVITVRPDTPIQEVARIMRAEQISSVPVLDEKGKLVGIVTEVDLISRHATPRQPHYYPLLWGLIPMGLDDYAEYKEQVRQILAVNAAQLMTQKPTTVHPEDGLERVASLMIKPGHHSLPVLEDGRLVGIVTRTDLVHLIEGLEMGGP